MMDSVAVHMDIYGLHHSCGEYTNESYPTTYYETKQLHFNINEQ